MTEERSPDLPGRDALLVAIAVLVAYALVPWGDFHYDDVHHVVRNDALSSLENVPSFFEDSGAFSSLPHHRLYRPVLLTTFALDRSVWGVQPHGFLITNLLIHLATALAVWGLARRVLGPGRAALFAGLLFAIHPVLSETVNYVSARSSSLATLFAVLAVLAHLRGDREAGLRSVPWRLVTLLLLAAGLLTKAIVVTVPILAVLASWTRDAREGRAQSWFRRAAPLVPMLLVVAVWWVVMRQQVGDVVGGLSGRWTTSVDGDHLARSKRSVLANLATQARVFWIYVALILLPIDLSVDRFVRISESFADPLALVSLLALVALVALAFRVRSPIVRLGILWFGVALLPTSSVKPLLVLLNEHRLYLPFVGLVLPAGVLLAAGWRRPPLRAVVVVVLALLGLLSLVRTRDWRDEETLWRAAVRSSPRSYQAHTNLGIQYYRRALEGTSRGRSPDQSLLREALAEYAIAEPLFPTWFNVPFNQGLAHLALGRASNQEEDFDAAEERFRRCLELSPGSFRARWHLAVVDSARGRTEEALAAFEAMRADDPSRTALYHHPIGRLQGELERWEDAEKTYREVLEIEGESFLTSVNIARAIEGQGRLDEAEADLRALVTRYARTGVPRIVLARFLRRTDRGEPGEIGRLFQEALMRGYRPTTEETDEILARRPMTDDAASGSDGGRGG